MKNFLSQKTEITSRRILSDVSDGVKQRPNRSLSIQTLDIP